MIIVVGILIRFGFCYIRGRWGLRMGGMVLFKSKFKPNPNTFFGRFPLSSFFPFESLGEAHIAYQLIFLLAEDS